MAFLTKLRDGSRALRRSFLNDRRGTVAVVFAIALLPTIAAIGCAIDYGRAVERETLVKSVADSAVLAATSRAGLSLKPDEARALVLNVFDKLSASSTAGITITAKDVSVTDTTSSRTAAITFAGTVPTSFMKILSIHEMRIGGTAQSFAGLMKPTDVYLLLDNSPSMGLAASTADMEKLRSATSAQYDALKLTKMPAWKSCEFACHSTDNAPFDDQPKFQNYFKLARSSDVVLRIDRLRQAAREIITFAKDRSASSNSTETPFRFAIYTYGKTSELTSPGSLTTVRSLTADLTSADKAASSVDLMLASSNTLAVSASPHATVLGDLLNEIRKAPNASGRRRMVVFVSDGVADGKNPDCQSTDGIYVVWSKTGVTDRCISPLDPRPCQTMKDEGIDVLVLYTTYLPLTSDKFYDAYVKNRASLIEPRMQECSSGPQFFKTVGIDEDIVATLKTLFVNAVYSSRLTQ
jgi:hypothetical protein